MVWCKPCTTTSAVQRTAKVGGGVVWQKTDDRVSYRSVGLGNFGCVTYILRELCTWCVHERVTKDACVCAQPDNYPAGLDVLCVCKWGWVGWKNDNQFGV